MVYGYHNHNQGKFTLTIILFSLILIIMVTLSKDLLLIIRNFRKLLMKIKAQLKQFLETALRQRILSPNI